MIKNKTIETENDVKSFIDLIENETKKNDCFELIKLITAQTKLDAKMWGKSIVGFGSYHYRYESGREGDSPKISFSPRASSIAIYLSADFENKDELLKNLGKHRAEKACIHIKTLADIDVNILKTMIENHLKHTEILYPQSK
ncbi:MAG: DUF1801 domain-containing protein [Bacteroidetes bacterium]|nr:MAG: DUF1801 domain-containing protein [Bacteroidota bacterium]TAG90396.1 MAG: DUF1801 domain-containing protein [Bacteroidota bacterium]